MFIAAAQAAEAAGVAASGGFFSEPENWVAIVFIIVVALLVRPAGRAIIGGLDKHRDSIKTRLDEAERLQAEAQEMLTAQQKRQRDTQKEAEAMLAQARAEAERLLANGTRDLEELLKRREEQAIDRIAQAEADALREVRNTAVDVAIAATAKLIAEGLTGKQATALNDENIKALRDRLH